MKAFLRLFIIKKISWLNGVFFGYFFLVRIIELFDIFLNKILGLNFKKDKINNDSVLEILLKLRDNARKHKDYKLSDSIRDELAKIGINLNDKD